VKPEILNASTPQGRFESRFHVIDSFCHRGGFGPLSDRLRAFQLALTLAVGKDMLAC